MVGQSEKGEKPHNTPATPKALESAHIVQGNPSVFLKGGGGDGL